MWGGDAACAADEKPAHQVQITKPYEIGKYEVTQAQWMAVMGSNPSTTKGDNRPVETVSKNEAQDFLAKLTAMNDSYRYRLPTEAEWEYAARAGEPLPVSLDAVAWYAANSGNQTHPVGQKKPNAWGIYDMLGNVREWVSDLYAQDYYANSPAAAPTGPQGGGGYGRGRFGQNNFGFGRVRGFNNGGGRNQNPNNANGQASAAPIAYQFGRPQGGPPRRFARNRRCVAAAGPARSLAAAHLTEKMNRPRGPAILRWVIVNRQGLCQPLAFS